MSNKDTHRLISEMTQKECLELIQQAFKKEIPQVHLETELDIETEFTGFVNVKMCGTYKMWFSMSKDKDNNTTLSHVIAIQDPSDDWEINNHHFMRINTIRDMMEMVNYKLGLNGRI